VVPGLVPDVYASGAKRSGLVETAQSRLQMWDQIWWSSSLPYSGAKTTAAVETPSHTIAEATRPTYLDAAVEQRRHEDAKAENKAMLAISQKSETFTWQVNPKPRSLAFAGFWWEAPPI
jgi:hypothetical protein